MEGERRHCASTLCTDESPARIGADQGICHFCRSKCLELHLGVEFEGDIRRCVRHAEERAGGKLPVRHALAELEIRNRPETVLLVLESAGMGEILDLAIAFDTQRECLVKLAFQPPVDLELQAVNV